MEEHIYLIALFVAIIYCILKFLEMRFISKENITIKEIVTNTLIVYLSVIMGYFVTNQFDVSIKPMAEAPVFIDGPGF